MQIQWIFFDLGSTLVDEAAAYDARARQMLSGTGISFREFDEKRRQLAAQGLDGNSQAIRFFGLSKTPWPGELEAPYPQAERVLAELRARGYRLGIIANQAPGVRERLENWGLLPYFEVIASSSELGVSKPDPAIFRKAMEMAGCEAPAAAMVGDRLDNDIAPARELGMFTVWTPKGLSPEEAAALAPGRTDARALTPEALLDIFP